MHVYFIVIVREKMFRQSSWCSLNKRGLLNMGSTEYNFSCKIKSFIVATATFVLSGRREQRNPI